MEKQSRKAQALMLDERQVNQEPLHRNMLLSTRYKSALSTQFVVKQPHVANRIERTTAGVKALLVQTKTTLFFAARIYPVNNEKRK